MNTSNNSPEFIPPSTGGNGGCIFLIGFMGSGKTYWGKKWAQQSGRLFFDLDEFIEQEQQKTIAQIFEQQGEAHFRNLETAALKSFLGRQNCIVACGGGTPCFNNNMQLMNEYGTTIYLKALPQEIINRVTGEQDKRPLIKDLQPAALLAFIEKKLTERSEFYLQATYVLPVALLTDNTLQTLPVKQR